ncbi:MAG: DUF1800 family protein, partial [Pseudomonadota bacterium]
MSRKPYSQRTLSVLTGLVMLCGCFVSTAYSAPALLTHADARHLLSRTGLGVDHSELLHLTGKSRQYAINYILDGFSAAPALPTPSWVQQPAPLYWTREDLTPTDRQVFDRRRDAELIELRQWWVDNMLATDSPQTERMVLFWHDH